MLDLDGLKAINDTLGHQAGDDCLRTLADAIRSTCRSYDRGYRVGGDEFAVILDPRRLRTPWLARSTRRIHIPAVTPKPYPSCAH